MSDRFTEKAEKALNASVKIAEDLGHTYIGSEHILLALSEDDLSCASLILKKNGVTKEKVLSTVKEYSGIGIKSNLSSKDLTPRARKILEASYDNAIKHEDGIIGTEHILLSLAEERDSVAAKLLKSMKCDTSLIKEDILTLIRGREKIAPKLKRDTIPAILKQYGKNLCEMAKADKFDPVIGRDKETDRLIRVLTRKNKNNPCLVGEAGVGKTAIVEGLAQRLTNGDVPRTLLGKIIISIDLTSMVAGAKYRGDFEERIKNILNEVSKQKDIILFIDEIHTIVGAGAAEGAIDASNILKPQLARGEIQIIGATTYNEYHKYIEKDSALERRFQPIRINEPSIEETINMLIALKGRYEKHHGVKIEDAAIKECVELTDKYIGDRYLPDKAIDILDEACAMSVNISKNNQKANDNFEQYIDYASKKDRNLIDIRHICEGEYPSFQHYPQRSETPTVDAAVIKSVISEACGIPISMVQKNVDYAQLESELNSAIIGQSSTISKLVSAIRRSDFGLDVNNRPRGIFMFMGESGVGKTALATELAKNLFYNSSSLLRFDMSEYSEKQSVSKLIGSAPGYVGHEEGGALTESIKRNPHSVILFDEIEKAHPDVLNILLQISDYGYLCDSLGRHISFKNAIIIATSNIGSERITDKVGFSNTQKNNASSAHAYHALKKYYKEEFINRFDEIICFDPLSRETLRKIAAQRLKVLVDTLYDKGYSLTYENEVIEEIVSESAVKGLGARPILREIAVKIEDKVIDNIINRNKDVKRFKITVKDGIIEILDEKVVEI